jgi:hypothetical protein
LQASLIPPNPKLIFVPPHNMCRVVFRFAIELDVEVRGYAEYIGHPQKGSVRCEIMHDAIDH